MASALVRSSNQSSTLLFGGCLLDGWPQQWLGVALGAHLHLLWSRLGVTGDVRALCIQWSGAPTPLAPHPSRSAPPTNAGFSDCRL